MAKDILDIFNLGVQTGRFRSDRPNRSNPPQSLETAKKKSLRMAYPDPEGSSVAINNDVVSLPKCPKCNKIPLKCPNPDDCGMENL